MQRSQGVPLRHHPHGGLDGSWWLSEHQAVLPFEARYADT
jgi:hypothetical protein